VSVEVNVVISNCSELKPPQRCADSYASHERLTSTQNSKTYLPRPNKGSWLDLRLYPLLLALEIFGRRGAGYNVQVD